MVVENLTKSNRLDMGVESGQIPLPSAPLVVLRARVRGLYQSLSQTMTPPPLCVQRLLSNIPSPETRGGFGAGGWVAKHKPQNHYR